MIFVSGPPASGKTMLSLYLADRLDLPLVSLDALKAGIAGRDGAAAFRAFTELLSFHVDRGISFIADQALHAELAPAAMKPLMHRADLVVIQCKADHKTCRDRLQTRIETNSPRANRHTVTAVSEMDADVYNWGVYETITLDAPVLVVETDEDYTPGIDEIAQFAITAR